MGSIEIYWNRLKLIDRPLKKGSQKDNGETSGAYTKKKRYSCCLIHVHKQAINYFFSSCRLFLIFLLGCVAIGLTDDNVGIDSRCSHN